MSAMETSFIMYILFLGFVNLSGAVAWNYIGIKVTDQYFVE